MSEVKRSSNDYISVNSSKEDISNFFLSHFDFPKNITDNIIKEDISGEILLDLDKNDYKLLGIKPGPKKRIEKYIKENKEKFTQIPKSLKKIIDLNSNKTQVKQFFEEYLCFKGNINNIDGKAVLALSEEEMENIGLNIGQRKKLIKYINYFKNLNLKITEKSTKEEVNMFLKEKLKFSDEAIEGLALDAISFFQFSENEIDEFDELTEEEKANYKNYLKQERELKEKEGVKKEDNDTNYKDPINEENKNIKKDKDKEENQKNNVNIINEKNDIIINKDRNNNIINEITDNNKISRNGNDDIIIKAKKGNFINENNDNYNNNELNEKNDFINNKEYNKNKEKIIDIKSDNVMTNNFMEEIKDINKIIDKKNDDLITNKYNLNLNLDKNDGNSINNKNDISSISKNNDNIIFIKKKDNTTKKEDDIIITNSKANKEKEKNDIKSNKKNNEENNKLNNNSKKNNNSNQNKLYDNQQNQNQKNETNNKSQNTQEKNNISNSKDKIYEIKNEESNINNEKKFDKNKNKYNEKESPKENEIKKIIKKEYSGNNSSNITNYPLQYYHINPMIKDSKYNIFFILIIQEKYMNQSFLSTYSDETGYFSFSYTYINYAFSLINVKKDIKNNEKINYFLVQVPIQKNTKKLTINFRIDIGYHYSSYQTDIERRNEVENYFYIDNLKYYSSYSYYNNYPTLNLNDIFKNYLNYFFNKKNNEDESIQKSLLKAIINKLNYTRNVLELEPEIILRFFKYCLNLSLEPKNIKFIQIINQQNNIIQNEYFLTKKDISNFNIKRDEKLKLIYLIVKIYSIYNNEYLMELILSEDGKLYSKALFDLIIDRKIKFTDLKFENQENVLQFQNNLLGIAKSKRDIDNIIKLSKGLTNSLKFILNNYKIIYSILDENKVIYRSDYSNFVLFLSKLDNSDNITNIYNLLSKLFNIRNREDCYIINFEEFFDELVSFYSNKQLDF